MWVRGKEELDGGICRYLQFWNVFSGTSDDLKQNRFQYRQDQSDRRPNYEFCDCPYLNQEHYVETLVRLQDIFYLYKNEMLDEITDDELLNFMREQYETVCFGDLDYLEGTCLDIFAQAIRAGYRGYRVTDGRSEYGQFDEVKRWDYELYLEALQDLCWR